MEVILLEKIRNLGKLGDTVNVRPGYSRNYLIPQGKAIPATNDNRQVFEKRRAELEKAAASSMQAAEKRASALTHLANVTIAMRAADEGKLYGSVNNHDIVVALEKAGVSVEKSEVLLPLGPIRQIGEYEIDIQLHTDITAKVKVQVIPE